MAGEPPEILATREVARSRFYRIEEMDLRFSNGVERTYERLPARVDRGVLVVAVTDDREIVLVREYAAGFHDYHLSLPKGGRDNDESFIDCANRELKEEAGFGARHLEVVKKLSVAPGQMGYTITVVLALDLYEERLPGDEPEPLEVVPWSLNRLPELYAREDFNEARALAGIHLCEHRLRELGRL